MHLVIDGYNLIHHSLESLTAHYEQGRGRGEAMAAALRLYRQRKGHRVTVVFDGGPTSQDRALSWRECRWSISAAESARPIR